MKKNLCGLLACAAATISSACWASSSSREYQLELTRSSVRAVLAEFSRQTGLQTGFYPDDPAEERIMVGPLRGSYTAEEALEALFATSGLSFTRDNERTVTVLAREYGSSRYGTPAVLEPGSEPAGPVFVRLVDPRFRQGESIRANEIRLAGVSDSSPSEAKAVGRDERQGQATTEPLEEIVVTGSHIRGMRGSSSPMQVFDRAKIDELGVSTVSDILKYVPQQPYSAAIGRDTGGAQFIEIRGLGVDTTLVLINGRRTAPSATNVSRNAFDLNTIPLAAVERVEVLSDSASAVYGADAVGGVINIILKKNISDPTVDLHYGAADGGGDERRASLSAGYSSERFRSSIVLDYFDRGFLLGNERDRWSNQDYRRFGGVDNRSLNTNPGNITSRTIANLPGLSSRIASVPVGSTGLHLTPADFQATTGQQRRQSLQSFSSIIPKADRRSAAGFGEFDISSAITAFGEVLFTKRESESQGPPSALSGAAVPVANPFNPFGVSVSSNYLFTGVGPVLGLTDAKLLRGVAGIRGKLNSWDWEISALRTKEDSSSWTENSVNSAQAGCLLTDPASRASGACAGITEALNVFQDGPGGSPSLLKSLVAQPVISRFSSSGTQGAGILRGSLLELPAGDIKAALGAEVRKEGIFFNSGGILASHDRKGAAIFAELYVPLLNVSMNVPGAKELFLTVAGRHDHYDDFGNVFNPQYGVVWRPVADLMLRASYGTSFRAPALFELYASRVTTAPVVPISDPRRGNEVSNVSVISGGNPDLDPVEGESLSAGVVWTPKAMRNLKVSTTYWKIKLDNRVAFFSAPLVLANEINYPERVVRDEPTPADVTLGRPGAVKVVDISRINFGSVKTDGIDISASYALDTQIGRFSPAVSATWVNSYKAVTVPNTPASERVGLASSDPGTIVQWRLVGSLGWQRGGVGLSSTARYVPTYDDAVTQAGSNLSAHSKVDSVTLVDLQLTLDFDGFTRKPLTALHGVVASAGVTNVFDEQPPFSLSGGVTGYDSTQGDLRQRFGYMRISKRF